MLKRLLYCCIIIFSLPACKKDDPQASLSKITIGPGPEDIVYDAANNRLLVSCNERRTGYPYHGEIWQLDLNTDATSVLPRVDFPEGMPFFPHGFDLQTVDGQLYLYVINHHHDADEVTTIDRFKVNADNLEYNRSFSSRLLISPNDLTVVSDGSFYWSNDKGSTNILDLVTKPYSGSIGYCNGEDTYKKVDSVLMYPNGLFNEHGKLYLATSRNKALFTYNIQPDGSLQNRTLLNPIDGMDNITDAGDELIVAVHPDILKFVALSLDPTLLSPCKTYAINKTTGASTLLFQTDGSMISGASTSQVVGDNLYMGQVFGDFLLKISHYRSTK